MGSVVRISELSRRSGVATTTIKFYLREGLLPAGELTAATQAAYDASHLDRLRLIRALYGPGGMSLASIREVLGIIDQPPESHIELLGGAQEALGSTGGDDVDLAPAERLIERLGWAVAPKSTPLRDLAHAMASIDEAGIRLIEGGVERYAEWAAELVEAEGATVPEDSAESAVRQAVLRTILIEPLLLALRRLALQDSSRRRYEAADDSS